VWREPERVEDIVQQGDLEETRPIGAGPEAGDIAALAAVRQPRLEVHRSELRQRRRCRASARPCAVPVVEGRVDLVRVVESRGDEVTRFVVRPLAIEAGRLPRPPGFASDDPVDRDRS
jgi:hypothetical protein